MCASTAVPAVDTEVLRRFEGSGPRYTSYPTADRFVEAFGPQTYETWLRKRSIGGFFRPLSLYVHLPFCSTICYYCGCNKVVTKDHGRSAKYLKYVEKEVALQSALLDDRRVTQVHLGGGTPTFLSDAELRQLAEILCAHFEHADDAECSIEVDPRSVNVDTIHLLAELGFNRISVGVQDFDPDVQKAVNRIQSEAQTIETIEAARAAGFRSVNVDLIYGLPRQNVIGFNRTLEKIVEVAPDRSALYNYAHLPQIFKPQRRINEAELPDLDTRLQIFSLAVRRLGQAGYVHIGMDHFAKPEDDLAVAQRQGRLHRNFQGYSTHADCDMLGLGITAIGKIGPTYSQNVRTLDEYYDRLDAGLLPMLRGIELSPDDLVRRSVIQALMCNFELAKESVEISHLIDFDRYFVAELEELKPFVEARLLETDDDWLTVTPRGRYVVRAICMVFDRYLREGRQRASYSKVM
ncbi:MAG TPA: oxygen-independent coproporphyrinogen III oxidase [Burkholderiales bacterium]|nr:oxygen-independent coproporphyrinogen III oxidase [Burkholderiales bacterium]